MVAYVTSIWVLLGAKWTLKSISIASRFKYLVCVVSLHSQRHFKTHLLFLSGVAELKLDVIDPIIVTIPFLAYFTSPMLVGCVGVLWPFDTF